MSEYAQILKLAHTVAPGHKFETIDKVKQFVFDELPLGVAEELLVSMNWVTSGELGAENLIDLLILYYWQAKMPLEARKLLEFVEQAVVDSKCEDPSLVNYTRRSVVSIVYENEGQEVASEFESRTLNFMKTHFPEFVSRYPEMLERFNDS